MEQSNPSAFGYSPEVYMWLETAIAGQLPLRQVAPTFVIPFESISLPECNAVIVVTVDGKRFERPVHLPGMSPSDLKVSVYSRDDNAPF